MRIDLHTHSTASDGTDTPAELVRNAAAAGLDVVALTDHDTTRGHAEARRRAARRGSRWSPAPSCPAGSTASACTCWPTSSTPRSPRCSRERELVRDDRVPRARAMVAKLSELGVPVTWEQVARIAGDGVRGPAARRHRPRRAGRRADRLRRLHRATGWPTAAGPTSRSTRLDPFEAIRLVKAAGGVTVFAHPRRRQARRVRCRSPRSPSWPPPASTASRSTTWTTTRPTRARLRGLAADLGLLATGSSDYHGSRKTCRARRVHDRPRGLRRDHAARHRRVPGAGRPAEA